MFDTGIRASITLNDNFINLPKKNVKGTGFVASGQSFKTYVNDTIKEVKFLMTFGYRFLSQYKTVWDYDNKKIYILEY